MGVIHATLGEHEKAVSEESILLFIFYLKFFLFTCGPKLRQD